MTGPSVLPTAWAGSQGYTRNGISSSHDDRDHTLSPRGYPNSFCIQPTAKSDDSIRLRGIPRTSLSIPLRIKGMGRSARATDAAT